MLNKKFWKNKKVFLTGNCGFKGTWLSIILMGLGANIKGFSLKPDTPIKLFDLCNLNNEFETIIEDIRNKDKLYSEIQKFNPEIIIHLAAQPLVLQSIEDPYDTFDINVMGLINLLNAARAQNNLKIFINVTSDKCYFNKEKEIAYVESDILGGKDPYSCSKSCSELITYSFRESYFKDNILSSVRAGNVIGGGDWSNNRLVPDIVKNIFENKKLVIRSIDSIRPWQHVIEPLHGYLTLIQNSFDDKKFEGAWNFGPKDEQSRTVLDVISTINNFGFQLEYENLNTINLESKNLRLNSSKAKKFLNWEGKLDFTKTIEKTISWYKNYYDGSKALDLCINDINSFNLF